MKTSPLLLLAVGALLCVLTGCASTHHEMAATDPKSTADLAPVASGPPEGPLLPKREVWWSSPRMQLSRTRTVAPAN